jgi:hypothetical protein
VGLLIVRLVIGHLPMLQNASPIVLMTNGFPTGAITPMALAFAVIDTVIFGALILAVMDLCAMIQTRSKRLPEGGNLLFLATLIIVVALAYRSYAGVIQPLLGADLWMYDWAFLIVGILPVIGLALVAYRNLDAITEAVFHQTQGGDGHTSPTAPAANTCAGCGKELPRDAKFCAGCGTPVPASEPPPPVFCSACGVKNEANARVCQSCGKPLARAAS